MQTWAQVFTRARSDVLFRDVKIKIPDSWLDQGCECRYAPEAWAEIWEKSVSWVLGPRKTVDFRGSPNLGQWPCGRCRTWFGANGIVRIERWYLSPYVEKTFNSIVIKGFVRELRSRKCFCVSGFLCYLYIDIMNVLRIGMNMSISHIQVWLCNTCICFFRHNRFIFFLHLNPLSRGSQREPLWSFYYSKQP